MIDLLIYSFLHYTYILILILLVAKTVFFFHNRSKRWKMNHYFHFSGYNIRRTEDPKREVQKRTQNWLSFTLLILIILQILFLFKK